MVFKLMKITRGLNLILSTFNHTSWYEVGRNSWYPPYVTLSTEGNFGGVILVNYTFGIMTVKSLGNHIYYIINQGHKVKTS